MERERSSGNDGLVDGDQPAAGPRWRPFVRAPMQLASRRAIITLALACLCLAAIAVTVPREHAVRTAMVAGRWGASAGARTTSAEGPFLVVPPESLALGEAWDQPWLEHALKIRNNSPHEVAVERIVAGCGCAQVAPTSLVLPPGAEQVVHLQFTLREHAVRAPMSATWPIDVPLTFVNRDGRTQDVRPSGTIRAPFSIPGGGYMQFAKALEHGQPAPAFEFSVQKHAKVGAIWLRTEDPRVAQVAEREALRTATSATFAVLPRADLPLGRFDLALAISGRTDDGGEVGPYPVVIGGVVECDVHSSRRAVLLLASPAGSSEESLRIATLSGLPLAELELVAAPPEVLVQFEPARQDERFRSERMMTLRASPSLEPGTSVRGTVMLSVRSAAQSRPALLPISVAVHAPSHALSHEERP